MGIPWSRAGELVLDFIFPRRCFGCGTEGEFICVRCYKSLPFIAPPFCPGCGAPRISATPCPSCVKGERVIDGIRSVFYFEGLARKMVHELKYHNIRAASGYIAHFMAGYLMEENIPADVLVPVPLHSRRLRERGYNQSLLLARAIAKLTGLQAVDGLVRTRYSQAQVKTPDVAARRENVRGAFSCEDDAVRGCRVLVIDDVVTSGATLDACARALKARGAQSVWGLTLAREVQKY